MLEWLPAVARHHSRIFPGGEETRVVHPQKPDPRRRTLAVSRAPHHDEGSKLVYALPKGGKFHVLELYDRIISVLKEWRCQQLEERMDSESYSTSSGTPSPPSCPSVMPTPTLRGRSLATLVCAPLWAPIPTSGPRGKETPPWRTSFSDP